MGWPLRMFQEEGYYFVTSRCYQVKPCASDRELLEVIDSRRHHKNLDIEVSGIAGLPFASAATLEEEVRLVERVTSLDCLVGYQRLEAQPGALATEHPARFDMVSEARTFTEFLEYFEQREPGDVSVPMLRFRDAALERAVQRTSEHVEALARNEARPALGARGHRASRGRALPAAGVKAAGSIPAAPTGSNPPP